jgi:acetylornithine deacetylase
MTSSPAGDLLERLVAIPSVTGSEEALVRAVSDRLAAGGWECVSIPVSPGRRNLLARRGAPAVVLSTHADTVPPFFPARRAGDGDVLHARGACDAKGSLAAMITALEGLPPHERGAGLLLVVGEERGSDGALAANAFEEADRTRFLVGGEPTNNRFVAGSKGCLRVAIETRGVSGHSSISSPDGSRSAVDPLLDMLADIRRLALAFPADPVFGATTANVGVIEAGTAPNVVADRGRAEIVFRTGVPIADVLAAVERAASGRAGVSVDVPYRSEPIGFRIPRSQAGAAGVVSFACDLPLLSRWGAPLLAGPGSIAHAHAEDERVSFAEVDAAAALYRDTVAGLLSEGEGYLS